MTESLAFLGILLGQSLAGDARLQKAIQVAEYARDAPTVCADLGKLTGVTITCDPFLKDDLVVLVVKNRPAAEIMAKIASTFDWQWLPQNGGYRLAPTDRFVYRSRTGRDEILLAEGLRRQKAARDLLNAIDHQDSADIERREDQAWSQMKKDQDSTPWDTRQEHQKTFLVLLERLNPFTPIALATFIELDPESLLRLQDTRIVESDEPGPLEIPMGEGATARLEKVMAQIPPAKRDPDDSTSAGQSRSDRLPFVSHVDISLDDWDHGQVIGHDEVGRAQFLGEIRFPEPARSPLPALPKLLKDAFDAPAKPSTASLQEVLSKPDYEPLAFFATCLSASARRVDADVISDAYDNYYMWAQEERTKVDMDGLRETGVRPRLDEGWLVVRCDQWPRWRAEHIPRAIYRLIGPHPQLKTIDERANAFSQLSEVQRHSPLSQVYEYEYWFFRAWNELPPQVRGDLRAGKSIALRDLSASWLTFLYIAGKEPKDEEDPLALTVPSGMGPFSEPEFVDYKRMADRLSPKLPEDPPTDETTWPGEYRYNDFAFLYPGRLDDAARLSLQTVTIPSVYNELSEMLFGPGDLVLHEDFVGIDKAASRKLLRHAETTAVRCHFLLRKGVEIRQDLAEVLLGKPLSADQRSWPKDFLDRMKRRAEIQKKLETLMGDPPPPPR